MSVGLRAEMKGVTHQVVIRVGEDDNEGANLEMKTTHKGFPTQEQIESLIQGAVSFYKEAFGDIPAVQCAVVLPYWFQDEDYDDEDDA